MSVQPFAANNDPWQLIQIQPDDTLIKIGDLDSIVRERINLKLKVEWYEEWSELLFDVTNDGGKCEKLWRELCSHIDNTERKRLEYTKERYKQIHESIENTRCLKEELRKTQQKLEIISAQKEEILQRLENTNNSKDELRETQRHVDRISTENEETRQQLKQRIKEFNQFYEGKNRQQVVAKEEEGDLVVHGPLMIYWGVEQAIQFQKIDNEATYQSPAQTNWRHSFRQAQYHPVIFTDDKKKSLDEKTHVFTPMLGSCTSVTVDSRTTTNGVIRTLLDKFKIENEPAYFSLYMVSENEGETLLRMQDIPLLERITLGPDERSGCKLYLKDRLKVSRKGSMINYSVLDESAISAVQDDGTRVVTLSDDKKDRLPTEIEQLVALPEAVLQGFLRKFNEDEEADIQTVKERYDLVRSKIREQLEKVKSEDCS